MYITYIVLLQDGDGLGVRLDRHAPNRVAAPPGDGAREEEAFAPEGADLDHVQGPLVADTTKKKYIHIYIYIYIYTHIYIYIYRERYR